MPESNLSRAAAGVVAAMPSAIWRADQMAVSRARFLPSGHAVLNR